MLCQLEQAESQPTPAEELPAVGGTMCGHALKWLSHDLMQHEPKRRLLKPTNVDMKELNHVHAVLGIHEDKASYFYSFRSIASNLYHEYDYGKHVHIH